MTSLYIIVPYDHVTALIESNRIESLKIYQLIDDITNKVVCSVSAGSPLVGMPGCYINVRHSGVLSMVLLQLEDSWKYS